jgi:endonuclease/exonuclease/phosphatase family metal-dependent hydrolase
MDRRSIWRVATLNIWNRGGPWPQRLPLIRDGLRALDADVIGLQEVLGFPGMPSQAHEIAAGSDWNVFHAPAWELGGGLTLGNAILSSMRGVRRSRGSSSRTVRCPCSSRT